MSISDQNLNDWVEYKLLVLAELERLNDCVNELQKGCNEVDAKIINLKRDHEEAMQAISTTNDRIQNTLVDVPEGKWKFYTAVVTLVATAVASLVSLTITLMRVM